jgi:phage major head subunit gpT-like protein
MPNLVTSATYADVNRTVSMVFENTRGDTPLWWPKVATMIPSSTPDNIYFFQNEILRMEEWIGPRTLQNLTNQEYILRNRKYQAAISIDVDQIEDDQLGVFSNRVSALGRAAAKWPDQLARESLQGGTAATVVGNGFDGVPFFSTTHTVGVAPAISTTQSNNLTAASLTAATYETARETMMCYTGEDGESLGVTPNLLVVPPQLEASARTILNAEFTVGIEAGGTGGNTNVFRGSAELLVVPELCNEATTWYLADTSKPMKPLIWQLRKTPTIVSKTQEIEDGVFFDDQFVWGVKGRGRVGYGVWWLMTRNAP